VEELESPELPEFELLVLPPLVPEELKVLTLPPMLFVFASVLVRLEDLVVVVVVLPIFRLTEPRFDEVARLLEPRLDEKPDDPPLEELLD